MTVGTLGLILAFCYQSGSNGLRSWGASKPTNKHKQTPSLSHLVARFLLLLLVILSFIASLLFPSPLVIVLCENPLREVDKAVFYLLVTSFKIRLVLSLLLKHGKKWHVIQSEGHKFSNWLPYYHRTYLHAFIECRLTIFFIKDT
jgi:hypothetical protein